MGVDESDDHEQVAGDQGLMFGYASNETDVLMPAPITYSQLLVKRQSEVRKDGTLPWLEPDAKSQLTMRYSNGKPEGIDAVVLSTQHRDEVSLTELRDAVMEEIIKPVLPAHWIDENTKYFINPTGRFVIGGPDGDTGLTGRKIIVDTYGGAAPHGGGAFSGKDPTKVDRSAAYAARHIAKNILETKIASKAEVQLSYAIGKAEPVSIMVNTFGTGKVKDSVIESAVKKVFDLRPSSIISRLELRNPIYQQTATYGHFGRNDLNLPWERTELAKDLEKAF